MKALDLKVEGLTSEQLKKLLDSIQVGTDDAFKKNLIANDDRTVFEILNDKVYSDRPIYKDDKSNTLYVLFSEIDFRIYALMTKGQLVFSNWQKTQKKIYRAIVEAVEKDKLKWMKIFNPVYDEIKLMRHENRKDSLEAQRKTDYDYDQNLIKRHVFVLEKELKDSDFEHDNYLLIARKAALKFRNGDEAFAARIKDKYQEVSYEAGETFMRLVRTYLSLFGKEYSPAIQQRMGELTKKYAGWPWRGTYDHWGVGNERTIIDKSGYKLNIEKYLFKRTKNFENAKDDAIIRKLEEEYNKFIKEEFEPTVSEYIRNESWDKLKGIVDKIKALKEKLDAMDKNAKDTTNNRWYNITAAMTPVIDSLYELKEETKKIRQTGAQ